MSCVRTSKKLALAGLTVLVLGLWTGCATVHEVRLPPPIQSTTLGVGDEFELRIAGEKDLGSNYVVAPDGTVDLPMINNVKVDGLEPQQVAAKVRSQLIEGQFFTNPSVSVLIKAYNSKRIEVIGEVKKAGSLPLEPGMTLLRAISLSGGFGGTADKSHVTIRRRVNGQMKIVSVNVNQIIDNRIQDVPLQAGDTINVDETIL